MNSIKKLPERTQKGSLEEILILGLQARFAAELGNTLVIKGSKNGSIYYSLTNTVPDYDLNLGKIINSEQFTDLNSANPQAYKVVLSVMKRGRLSDLFFSEETSDEFRIRGRNFYYDVLREIGFSEEEIKKSTINYAQR